MRHFIDENKEEHKEILAKFGVFTLEKDTNALANKIRAMDGRIDEIETRMDKVEAKPIKEKAAIVDSIVRYGLVFLGSGVFLYIITHLGDIAAWFRARP
jgi:Flp pilus assembly protein TadB